MSNRLTNKELTDIYYFDHDNSLPPTNVQKLVNMLCYCRGNYQHVTDVPFPLIQRIENCEVKCLTAWFREKYKSYSSDTPPYHYIGLHYSSNLDVIEQGFMNIADATKWSTSIQIDMYSRGLFGCLNPFCTGKLMKLDDAEDDDSSIPALT
jgi:hypothetical protein